MYTYRRMLSQLEVTMTDTRLIQPEEGLLKRYLHSKRFSVTGLKGNRETSCLQAVEPQWINKCTSVKSRGGGWGKQEERLRVSG